MFSFRSILNLNLGDPLDQERKVHKHEQEVRKTLEKLLKLFDEKEVIEIVDGFKFKFLRDQGKVSISF